MTNIDSMLLPDLKKVASSLGLKGTGQMRKAELLTAIRDAQGSAPARGGNDGGASQEQAPRPRLA